MGRAEEGIREGCLMPRFGNRSTRELNTLHDDLKEVLNEAIKYFDFSVIEGYRDEDKQFKMVQEGHSKLAFPKSKHNRVPSLAVDIAPYPIDWEDTNRFSFFAGFIMGIAKQKGIELRWGGNWDRDEQMKENKFNDLPHLELL